MIHYSEQMSEKKYVETRKCLLGDMAFGSVLTVLAVFAAIFFPNLVSIAAAVIFLCCELDMAYNLRLFIKEHDSHLLH